MDSNGSYKVTQVSIRTSPQLNANGRVSTNTIVSFYVGQHGPFSLIYPPNMSTPDQITKDITSKVNEIRTLDSAVNTLNQQR